MDARRLSRLLDSLHATDDVFPVLLRLCRVGSEVTPGAGVGVSRIVAGTHEVLEASDAQTRAVEQLQVRFSEGPCLDAIASYRPALEPDLSSERSLDRWPKFARAALDRGIAAAFAFPLITGGVAVGALDVYSPNRRSMGSDEVADALVLAGLAALAVDRPGGMATIDGVDAATEATEPWAHPAVVHNASGMISEQLGIDSEEALLRLRASAFALEVPVMSRARDVVNRTFRLESWSDRD